MIDIKKQYIPLTRRAQRPQLVICPQYITIHSTGNPTSTAQNEADYVCYNSNRYASFHFVVDDSEIIQVMPCKELAYHSGTTRGNKYSISIEICKSGDRLKAINNTIALTLRLMKEYNIPISRVLRHYDWNNKNCPRILIDENYIKKGINWDKFLEMLKGERERMNTEKIYNSLEELEGDFKRAIEWALDNKILYGTGKGLGLNETTVKCLVFLWRYHKNKEGIK